MVMLIRRLVYTEMKKNKDTLYKNFRRLIVMNVDRKIVGVF